MCFSFRSACPSQLCWQPGWLASLPCLRRGDLPRASIGIADRRPSGLRALAHATVAEVRLVGGAERGRDPVGIWAYSTSKNVFFTASTTCCRGLSTKQLSPLSVQLRAWRVHVSFTCAESREERLLLGLVEVAVQLGREPLAQVFAHSAAEPKSPPPLNATPLAAPAAAPHHRSRP